MTTFTILIRLNLINKFSQKCMNNQTLFFLSLISLNFNSNFFNFLIFYIKYCNFIIVWIIIIFQKNYEFIKELINTMLIKSLCIYTFL